MLMEPPAGEATWANVGTKTNIRNNKLVDLTCQSLGFICVGDLRVFWVIAISKKMMRMLPLPARFNKL
jgi:hypothetical protein